MTSEFSEQYNDTSPSSVSLKADTFPRGEGFRSALIRLPLEGKLSAKPTDEVVLHITNRRLSMGKDVIIACDFPSAADTYRFLDKFTDKKPFVKIGMELFYSEGPEIVRQLKSKGHKIFLDLKLHDIPNTVKSAMAVLTKLDIDIVNVHASGTVPMMEAALEGLKRPDGTRPLLIAVTQLTSTDQEHLENDLMIHEPISEVVMHYAENAATAGLDGVVCSPLEAALVHEKCGKDFLTVTPGVRFADAQKDDQRRVMTPAEANKIGSDYIVVGRPITKAEDPVEAYERCVKEFCEE